MIRKGYIFKNKEGRWELGFVYQIAVDDALYETYEDYPRWSTALEALIEQQMKEA